MFFYSLYARFAYIGDGGDNLLAIILFFLMFANTTRYFSIESYLGVSKSFSYENFNKNKFFNIIQNFVVIFCIMQVCVVYITSAFYQIMGESWSNGTALYYVSQVQTLSTPLLEKVSTEYIYFTVLITYMSILVKIAFPLLIINKKTKLIGVLLICFFHLGVGIGMELYSFSISMIAVELLIFTDQEYKSFFFKINKIYGNIIVYFKEKIKIFSVKFLSGFKITVFYDGWCPLCKKTKRNIKKIDIFDLVVFKSFRNPEIVHEYKLNSTEVSLRMHSKAFHKEVVSGIDSFIDLSKRIIPMWFLLPIFYLSKITRTGNLVYDFVATKRKIVPVNQCDDKICNLPASSEKELE